MRVRRKFAVVLGGAALLVAVVAGVANAADREGAVPACGVPVTAQHENTTVEPDGAAVCGEAIDPVPAEPGAPQTDAVDTIPAVPARG